MKDRETWHAAVQGASNTWTWLSNRKTKKNQISFNTQPQFSSVQFLSCVWFCNTMDCSMPSFLVYHQLSELAPNHVHWFSDAIQPSHPVIPLSFSLQSFPASGSFPMSQFFTSDGQSIAASASASVLPMNFQNWFPLELTGWISLQCKWIWWVFFNTTVQ